VLYDFKAFKESREGRFVAEKKKPNYFFIMSFLQQKKPTRRKRGPPRMGMPKGWFCSVMRSKTCRNKTGMSLFIFYFDKNEIRFFQNNPYMTTLFKI